MITKVRHLTRMNVNALKEIGFAKTVGATYAEFDGTPEEAADKLTEVMQERGLDTTTYRSLQAVRRKLRAAAVRYDASNKAARVSLTPNVDVLREEPTKDGPTTRGLSGLLP